MYKPRIYGPRSLLWFVSGVGVSSAWSWFELQRRNTVFEMVPFTTAKADQERWAEICAAEYRRLGSRSRAVTLN